MRRRILVVAEAVTLAHLGRPLTLAKILEQLGHEVVFACAPAASRWLAMEGRAYEPVWSISSEDFKRSLARGAPLYDRATLLRYVEDDLDVIDRVRPDLIIGDFRLSLYVSARLRKRPYGAVTNAYWSPRYFEIAQVPDIPLVRWLGAPVADAAFRATYRAAFRWHARPFLDVCAHFGVAAPGRTLLDVYTSSDCTAFADVEEFYAPRSAREVHEEFIGPLEWSPSIPLPAGHEQWGRNRPLVYVSLGSSGSPRVAQRVLDALDDAPVDVVASTAGARLERAAPGVVMLDYAPGEILCRRAALVIGNGGSPVAYQALQAAVPLLGLASNFDQFLNMRMIERVGAGRCMRASHARVRDIRREALELIGHAPERDAALRGSRVVATYHGPKRIGTWLAALGV